MSFDTIELDPHTTMMIHRKSMEGVAPTIDFHSLMTLDPVLPHNSSEIIFSPNAASSSHTFITHHLHTNDVTSPSDHRSRSSSPYSSSEHASLPPLIDEPVWLECTTEEDVAIHSEEESASQASHQTLSNATTPQQLDDEFQHQPSTIVMPTIQELQRASMPQVGMLVPMIDETILSSVNITTTNVTTSTLVSTPNTSNERIQIRARRRTRYTTAADASAAARASVSTTSSSCGSVNASVPFAAPTLDHQVSHGSNTPSMDLTSTGSAHSSEHDDEEDDDFVESSISPGKQAAKRKRGGARSASATIPTLDECDPNSPGLDKKERNKLSASLYRKRRKMYLDSLESKVGELDQTIAAQNETIQRQAQENKALKEQISFMKKMLASFKSSIGAGSSSSSSDAPMSDSSTIEEPQPTNIHHGARRAFSSSASAFLFLILALCLAFNPYFMSEDASTSGISSTPSMAATGRRGRSLLSFESESISTNSYSSSPSSSASSSNTVVESAASDMMTTPVNLERPPNSIETEKGSSSKVVEDLSSSVASLLTMSSDAITPLLQLVSQTFPSSDTFDQLAASVKSFTQFQSTNEANSTRSD